MEPSRTRLVVAVVLVALVAGQASVGVGSATGGQVTVDVPSKVVTAHVGDVARVPLRFERTDTARLTVGSAPLDWKVALNVTDADGDGSVTVLVDTANARQSGTVFSAAGGDAVSNVTVIRGSRFAADHRRIAATAYPMSVETGGTETDVATLSLRSPREADRVCARWTGPLIDAYDPDDVPGLLSGVVADATIHAVVTDAEPRDYGITTGPDRSVSSINTGAPGNASVAVETDCATVRRIADAQNTTDAFGAAYDDGDVAVRGTTPTNAVLVEAAKLVLRFGKLFGVA